MSEAYKSTIRMVREEALTQGELDKLDDVYADDYVFHGIPAIGDVRGRTAFKDMAQGWVDAVSGLHEEVEDQIAEGDKVVTRISGHGIHAGELMGAPPTGKEITWTEIVISRFANGQIAEEWVEFDALSFMQQLGAVPK